MPKLLNSAPRPSNSLFRAYSSPLSASDLVLHPHCNSLATPAWPQQTPIDPLVPVSQPWQALLQPPHQGPSQRFLQAPLRAPLQAPLPPPSQPPLQVPFQEPFLDVLQPHDWYALKSALTLQT